SSHRSHSPSIRIDAVEFFQWDVAEKAAVVVRMSCRGQSQNLFGTVRNKEFFAGYADAFAAISCVNLRRMSLQPGNVTVEPLPLEPGSGKLSSVSHLFHHQRNCLILHNTLV